MSSKQVFKKIVWKIPNITKELLSSEKAKDVIFSKSFVVSIRNNYTKWELKLYLTYGEAKNVGLFLQLVEQSTINFNADFRLSIINSNPESKVTRSKKRSGKEFEENSWGYDDFIKREIFEEKFDEFAVDGSLIIICGITVTLAPNNDETNEGAEIHSLTNFTESLFLSEYLSDFEIQAGDNQVEDFKCHKFVLASKSPVFDAMFNNNLSESLEGKCKIPDFDPATIKEMLRFMYCEEVDGLDAIARKLIYAAEKYELGALKNLCMANIIDNLNEDNVIDAMLMSNEISEADSLFQECMIVVMNNYKDIRKQQEWKELPNELLLKVSDSLFGAMNPIYI